MTKPSGIKEDGAVANPLAKLNNLRIIQGLEAHTSDSNLLKTKLLLFLSWSLLMCLLLTFIATTAGDRFGNIPYQQALHTIEKEEEFILYHSGPKHSRLIFKK